MGIIEIKNRNGNTIYSCAEAHNIKQALKIAVKGGADLRGADLRDTDLRCADLRGADLRDTDLRCADLRGADLRCVDLRGADLRDTDLRNALLRNALLRNDIVISKLPIIIQTPMYDVIIYDNHIRIGCQLHAASEWFNFNNKKIIKMDGRKALEWWVKWKPILAAICAAEGRGNTDALS